MNPEDSEQFAESGNATGLLIIVAWIVLFALFLKIVEQMRVGKSLATRLLQIIHTAPVVILAVYAGPDKYLPIISIAFVLLISYLITSSAINK